MENKKRLGGLGNSGRMKNQCFLNKKRTLSKGNRKKRLRQKENKVKKKVKGRTSEGKGDKKVREEIGGEKSRVT